ncbi:cation diffusion facilitator family transporter [uncultured Paraglaciecola sp.]|uniref:cation diffusion facilitator family transporter n=1 Tax=uncultured Paraglaciecola sp. TaxID=1765024 RepID=UPI0030D89E16|tara:strand:- start:2458 stop:3300 length:843 start_codon:yes stop_codon:yes gene_type:complete
MNVKRVLLIEGSVNLLMSVVKLGVGISANSAAVIADAVHSFTDVINNIFAWMATNIANSPADEDHQYGHQKFEQIAVFGLASLLSVVAFEMLVGAYNRFGEPVEQNFLGLIILICTLVANILLTIWERYWANRLESDILQADASHTLSDVLTTVVVIVGWQLAALGYYWLDTVFASIVSLLIFYLAFKLFQRAIPILVDYSDIDPSAISAEVNNLKEVSSVIRVRSRTGANGRVADVIVTVDPDLPTLESHDIADEIEAILASKFNIQDVLVHIEPKPSK